MMSSAAAPASHHWVVEKFGGTSLAAAECYANSAEIIRAIPLTAAEDGRPLRKCVVVSAMGEVKADGSLVAKLIQRSPGKVVTKLDKVTNGLIKCTQLAAQNDKKYLDLLQLLKDRHTSVVAELLGGDGEAKTKLRTDVLAALESDFADLSYILRAVWLSKVYDEHHNWWFGYGEIWSARLMTAYLNLLNQTADGGKDTTQDAIFVDAREIIQLTKHKDPTPDYVVSKEKLDRWLVATPAAAAARIIVVTGYIATTATGTPTTLGRDGSDYSASIFAALLRARSVTIWTDVDGVYSANPGQVRSAVILPEMSYDEASELAYFGAKVLHPKTMTPVVMHSIPVWIRNTFNHQHPGSCIVSGETISVREQKQKGVMRKSPSMETVVGYGVRGFSEISNLCLLIVEGTGMIGVPGVCARLFGSLREAGVSVVLITQAGSEHSICLCLPAAHGATGLEVIKREFRDECESREIQTVALVPDVACLAIVGDGMRSRRGAAARMFAALADAGINIIAIAQGSSERNISVIVKAEEATKGLKAVHQAFLAADVDQKYEPLLGGAILASTSPSNSAAPSTSPSSSLLDRLFPLPIAATLQGLQSRGLSVSKISMILPTALSVGLWDYGKQLPNWAEMTRSQSVLTQILLAVARLAGHPCSVPTCVGVTHDLSKAQSHQQLVNALVFASVAMEKRHRIRCTLERNQATGGFDMEITSQYDIPCVPHGDLAIDQASILIWTQGNADPIRLQATIPATVIQPPQPDTAEPQK
jgi:aspartokinase/homoserine dehydrogenase 1